MPEPPVESEESRKAEFIVDEAVDKNPCKKPSVVEVDTPQEVGVQEKVEPPVGQAVIQSGVALFMQKVVEYSLEVVATE